MQSPNQRMKKVTEILENDAKMQKLFLEVTDKGQQSTEVQVSNEVMNNDNVLSICNNAVETENNCNVEYHTVENVEDQTLGTNDDVNSVKSKSGSPHKVKFNASKAGGDVLSQSHIDGSHESISNDCFVPLCNSETCAYENNSSPPKMSKSHPTTNDNCTPKEQKEVHEEEENDGYVSDLVLNTSFHKHGECKSPCGICAYVK